MKKKELLDKIAKKKAIKKKEAEKTINILAIDQASNCGWAITSGLYGVWDFNTRKDESLGMKWLRFRAKLEEVCKLEKISIIAYERPAGQHANSVIHSAKMVGILEAFCEENDIDYRSYSASEVKKHATGKGNAGKPAMIAAAQEKLGYEGKDDNEADALWILDLTKKTLNL